ncbi:MAG: efflux RND transporter periplasmic adaptor subunit [Alphaproteobacteria bacterium]|nr:efflux RND transporter periplasmic adaptor subunit [Alphaproteobacteria bacterium]
MRRKLTSVLVAAVIAIAATAWILSGQYGQANDTPDRAPQPAAETARAPEPGKLSKVRVRTSIATPREIALIVTGRTEASRSVELRAETEGQVTAVHAERGARIVTGDKIVTLRLDDRLATLNEYKALRRQREIEFEAARALNEKGYRAETSLAQAAAALDAARAAVERVEIDISKTVITAPFDGVLQDRPAEVGDYLREGDAVAMLVDLDPVVIAVDVAERQIGSISVGKVGSAELVGGTVIDGVVRYISASANPATRTFLVELESPNPDYRIAEGMTAELNLPLETKLAHEIAPGLLSLNDDGILGLNTVNAAGQVVFHPVDIIDGDERQVWVSGLPERVDLITVGQEFVSHGDTVEALPDTAAGS